MTVEVIPYAGWEECVRLSNGTAEVIVTKQVGPRIIRYGFSGGPNEFVEYPDQVGKRGESRYRSYGGHRLWVAPETDGWTNHPDNQPVQMARSEDEVVFTAPVESGTGFRKSVAIAMDRTGAGVTVRHMLRNTTGRAIPCALWGLSVMAPGGTAIVPHERFLPHAEKVLPARPMVLWHYTDMTDSRWTWGKKFVRLRQVPGAESPQKFGVLATDGWAAYANGDRLFIKRFPFDASASYPDFGCNAEIFTNHRMLEVESLGPLLPLAPGEEREHTERWSLHHSGSLPESDDALHTLILPLLAGA